MRQDIGIFTPFWDVEQRFEVDGADHPKALLLKIGFEPADADKVWSAITPHTTPDLRESSSSPV